MMQRELKTPQQLINEGYNSEAALVFLSNFFEEEKTKCFNQILSCGNAELPIFREKYKYICNLEKIMEQKVEIGIRYATEHPMSNGIQEEDI